MPDRKTISQRLYVKGGSGRYYMDARDLVGRRIALVPDGERFATKDPDVAFRMAAKWIADLGKEAESGTATGDDAAEAHAAGPKIVLFDGYARRYLSNRVKVEKLASSTAKRYNQSLRIFRRFLQETGLDNIPLAEINTTLINDFLAYRADMPGIRAGEKLSIQSIRNDVYALSGMLEYAYAEEVIQDNPVRRVRLPRQDGEEATFLEIEEGAALLETAAWFDLHPSPAGCRFLEPLIGTMLIEGTRWNETVGLLMDDIDLDRGVVRIRDNDSRELKTRASRRTIPLWPQYREIIVPHLRARRAADDDCPLVFPSHVTGGPLTDIRGGLKTLTEAAGIKKHVTPHVLRHTYGSVRIQTLDRGEPVALFTVARELGHSGVQLLEERYGHLLINRRRLPYVEYRSEEGDE